MTNSSAFPPYAFPQSFSFCDLLGLRVSDDRCNDVSLGVSSVFGRILLFVTTLLRKSNARTKDNTVLAPAPERTQGESDMTQAGQSAQGRARVNPSGQHLIWSQRTLLQRDLSKDFMCLY